jgi:hypothetical protein
MVKFMQRFYTYLLINAGFFAIDYLDNGYLGWAYFVVLDWGVGNISHYISLYRGGYFPLKKKWNDLKNPKDKSPIVLTAF